MANFILKTKIEKNIQDQQIWKKNDLVIERTECYRWGEDLYNCGYETDLTSLDDCWLEEIKWPDSLTPFARDTLAIKWHKDPYNSWQEDGWELVDVKMIFNGPLELIKIENDK
jgi:hypothetical protein